MNKQYLLVSKFAITVATNFDKLRKTGVLINFYYLLFLTIWMVNIPIMLNEEIKNNKYILCSVDIRK